MNNREKLSTMVRMSSSNQAKTEPQETSAVAAPQRAPSIPALMGKAVFKSGQYRVGDSLPELSAQSSGLCINQEHLQAYRQLCGFEQGQGMPGTYLHMLAFPLMLNILVQQQFPMKAMGQVHLRNKISVLQSFDQSQPLDMNAKISRSTITSKGLEWDIDVQLEVDNQLVWTSESTFLHRCKTDIERTKTTVIKKYGKPQQWSTESDLGRRYARVSGDYNPIHLTDLTAKLFGFKQAIAHGMWSKARCLAAMDKHLPDYGYSVAVDFHRPLFLPSQVQFYTGVRQGQRRFSLFNIGGDQAHLDGVIT
jgi:acyl dehydratase